MKKKFINESEISKTYGEITKTDIQVSQYSDTCYDTPGFSKTDERTQLLLNKTAEEITKNYLKNGLTNKEAEDRLKRDGPNKLPDKPPPNWVLHFLHEITNVFALLLWIGGILAIIAYVIHPEDASNLYLALVLWLCVLISAAFTLSQNIKSQSILDSFKTFSNSKSIVIREGKQCEVFAVELVVGDVVVFTENDKIPADIRIFEASDLTSNNCTLTGESKLIKLSTECSEAGYNNALESNNIAFFFTLCSTGTGKGVIIKSGKDTYMGKIASLSESVDTDKHSLEKETDKYIRVISVIAITIGIALFIGGAAVGYPAITNITMAIAVIVSNVPEGLLTCLIVSLAINAKMLNKKGLMSKQMKSLETLGSMTCICVDKTGTLTKNMMTVAKLWYDMEFRNVDGEHEDIAGTEATLFDTNDKSFKYLQFSAVCGSSSEFVEETPDDYAAITKERNEWQKFNPNAKSDEVQKVIEDLKKKYQAEYSAFFRDHIDERVVNGDADEAGLIKFFEKHEKINVIRKIFPQHMEGSETIRIPFTSETKISGFLRDCDKENLPEVFKDNDNNYYTAFKGAPEYLIKKCKYYMMNGKNIPIDNIFKNRFQKAYEDMQMQGLRTLAFAYSKLDSRDFPEGKEFKNHTGTYNVPISERIPNYPTDNLCMVGLIILEDPPR